MKIAYFDCFSGASGDMILGALLDAGLSVEVLQAELGRLQLPPFHLAAKKVKKRGLGGTQLIITLEEDHHQHHQHHQHQHHHAHRHLGDITRIIRASSLAPEIQETGIAIFTRLARAEAKMHCTSIEKIHFHEVGAMDAIIDVMGAVIGFHALGLEKIYCSPLHVGSGTVECTHGTLPVPAPATLELVQGKPIYSTGVQGELLTPTGAAILTTVAAGFGPMPPCTVSAIGYGAGTLDPPLPNLLRVTIGEMAAAIGTGILDQVVVLEADLREHQVQASNGLGQHLVQLGALEVFLLPTQKIPTQSGALLTVICPPEKAASCSEILLAHTGGAALRWRLDQRLQRLPEQ
ncbi:MAG: nickel pincer cofactor biosynthesis protein LarC [Desulfobacca sp.]|uniref:nickel pincer cofactor biosynthesis protein LarC n=1 Tax=Desulfobacca sp. TaxID=2067990 RepID=UPI0040492312